LRGRTRRVFEILSLTLGLAFVGFFAWHAVRLTYDSWRFNDVAQGVLAVPLWIPQLGYSTGLVILFVAFVDEFVHVIRGGDPRYEKPPPASAEEVVERAIQSGV
jgi:TRAP-type C4-dicarboxylate transport system permease small subunit